jgi:hypothetical protein
MRVYVARILPRRNRDALDSETALSRTLSPASRGNYKDGGRECNDGDSISQC